MSIFIASSGSITLGQDPMDIFYFGNDDGDNNVMIKEVQASCNNDFLIKLNLGMERVEGGDIIIPFNSDLTSDEEGVIDDIYAGNNMRLFEEPLVYGCYYGDSNTVVKERFDNLVLSLNDTLSINALSLSGSVMYITLKFVQIKKQIEKADGALTFMFGEKK